MIAAILDIVESKGLNPASRKEMDDKLRNLLTILYDRFEKYCSSRPALTQGDSIELLVTSWQPVVFLFHRLLMDGLQFRVGLGTGRITLQKDQADESDGPAFWNARTALDEIKEMRYMTRSADFRIDENSSKIEAYMVITSILFLTSFLGQSTTQLQQCYYYLWDQKNLSEISEIVKTSKANVSKTLSKTPCYILKNTMAFLEDLYQQ
jgi:hypothetical protein